MIDADDAVIEACAKALRAAVVAPGRRAELRPWAALPEALRESYRREARAVLNAYLGAKEREP
jgi:hypothetical protein